MKKVKSENVNNNRLFLRPTTRSCWIFTAVFPSFPHFFPSPSPFVYQHYIFRECSEWKENEKRQQKFHREEVKTTKQQELLRIWIWSGSDNDDDKVEICSAALYSVTIVARHALSLNRKTLSVSPSCTLHIPCRCWLYENEMRHFQHHDGENHDAHIIRFRFEVPITIKMSHTKATGANDSGRRRG